MSINFVDFYSAIVLCNETIRKHLIIHFLGGGKVEKRGL